ncbi:MAG: GAF domain-containing protein [Marinobacter sp.]|uniref:GAF domain-containing protein n=1 Tax=Marinobacter sp. TaxID=50741 RepID=UPI003F9D5517
MKAPNFPENENVRQAALDQLRILDTPPDARFDRLTRMAAKLLDAPIALISLIDRDRQWFKSCIGLNVSETPRSLSFCGHALFNTQPLIVEDARKDARFFDNPLVTGDPNIRFYVGTPLHSADGHCRAQCQTTGHINQ